VTNLPKTIQRYIGTAKLFVQAYTITRNPWPTRIEGEQMVDWAWGKAVTYHDNPVNVGMSGTSIGKLENKVARGIVCPQYLADYKITH
jgi:hypothetical protein